MENLGNFALLMALKEAVDLTMKKRFELELTESQVLALFNIQQHTDKMVQRVK